MSMSIPYVSTGRTRQKERTRNAIIDAARAQFDHGSIPTVEQAADAAGVSRATAYRYFANQRELLLTVQEWAAEPSLVPEGVTDVEARLLSVVDRIAESTLAKEAAYRAM